MKPDLLCRGNKPVLEGAASLLECSFALVMSSNNSISHLRNEFRLCIDGRTGERLARDTDSEAQT